MAYGFGFLPKVSIKTLEVGQSNNFTNFVSSHMAKIYKHIVQVLCMLNFNIDNKGIDEPASLKKAMAQHDWPK